MTKKTDLKLANYTTRELWLNAMKDQLGQTSKDSTYLGYTNRYKQFPFLRASGYYIGSAAHVSLDAVKRYILEQQGKDIFEYNVFGNPEQKNGNFTQEKLL